mmetsp:Transcript_7110/g.10602  ORF Transcript_7110/g.10602 Transcript_7110/m.10602 type:complete len:179 (+) Transcript_7110:52-588(+)
MTSYLNEPDTDSDHEVECSLSEEEINELKIRFETLKAEGNALFSSQDLEGALEKYSEIIRLRKSSNLPPDDVILANRSATYMGLKRYVPASHDALQAAKANPNNWKAHWRHALSLMEMAPKRFRTNQAIASLETCKTCATLPDSKRSDVEAQLQKARARLAKQDAETPMPDMSNCAPS